MRSRGENEENTDPGQDLTVGNSVCKSVQQEEAGTRPELKFVFALVHSILLRTISLPVHCAIPYLMVPAGVVSLLFLLPLVITATKTIPCGSFSASAISLGETQSQLRVP